MISVVVADDHAILRQGLVQLLSAAEGIEVVADVGDGDSLLEQIRVHSPNVVVLDVSMPGPGVLAICEQIREQGWPTKVVVLTMHQNAGMARQFLNGGAAGFVLKKSAFDELQTAIRSVASGTTFLSPSLAAAAIQQGDRGSGLSEREMEVTRLIAAGNTNQRIAAILSISEKTVQTHRARAMEKLGVHSGAQLVRRAVELGLLVLDQE